MTSEKKILTIVIPAYNAEAYLDECLESCVRQNLPAEKYEIIIVNDGSTDGTLQIAERWASGHGSIKVISQENKGLSVARNAGMEAAAGRYIMFVDSDDHIAENCLDALAGYCMTDNPDILRFCAANVTSDGAVRRFSYDGGNIKSGRDLLKEDFQVCAPFNIYRKSFLEAHSLKFYPGIFHEDNEFTPRAYWWAEKVISVNNLVYFVRQTPDSITRTPNPKRGYDLLTIIGLLTEFAEKTVTPEYRPYIYKQIADCINWCIRLTNNLKKEDAEGLLDSIYKNRHIFSLMVKSSKITHRIEGRLLAAFPKRARLIYNCLDLIHR